MLSFSSFLSFIASMTTLTIHRPDDWHVHLRDGDVLPDTVEKSALHFKRALVMPNLKPALTTLQSLLDYQERILSCVPKSSNFTPIMTFYLNEFLSPSCLEKSRKLPFIVGAKLYPKGATTNAEEGSDSLKKLYPLLSLLSENEQVLQIHGETVSDDIFQRETRFLTEHLQDIIKNFPKLKIVLEHISTAKAVDFIEATSPNVAATITPHHLYYNRNELLSQGLKPHYYCLPILKTRRDQIALQKAATSGNPKYFAGTDSAPHAQSQKESHCCPAGIYNAPYAVPFYAEVFETCGALNQLNHFLSRFGAEFYNMPQNEESLLLTKQKQLIPSVLPFGKEWVVPMGAGRELSWSVEVE